KQASVCPIECKRNGGLDIGQRHTRHLRSCADNDAHCAQSTCPQGEIADTPRSPNISKHIAHSNPSLALSAILLARLCHRCARLLAFSTNAALRFCCCSAAATVTS